MSKPKCLLIAKPSKVHGVGLFTVLPINKGAKVNLFKYGKWSYRSFKSLSKRGSSYYSFVKNYFFIASNGLGLCVPDNLHQFPVGYYINSSNKPNMDLVYNPIKPEYAIANKNIKAGEELFINYGMVP